MELFGINLTAGRDTFIPGDVVSGEVIIQSSKNEIIQGLVVKICGKAHVEWKKCFMKYRETQPYFNVRNTLTDLTSSRKERKLSRHVPLVRYFELDLPEGTFPPSFQSDHGCIRYDVNVTLTLKGGKECVVSRPFNIIDMTSRGTHSEYRRNSCKQLSSSITRSTLPWTRGRVHAHIQPHEGDMSLVKIQIECLPDLYCQDEIDVIQRIGYRVDQTKEFCEYSSIACKDVRRHDNITELIISKIEVPIVNHCRLISVRYYLKKLSINPDISWLPLSWQRGPEILITEYLLR
ncbi:thioredoxin-interacting protein-like isoform X1 [Lytechinus pictus]|uniref:thioredoxin-interacting protein-like isoform X1 n=2 Tax=Lytechinus pictus TaxID=7653 RepID=UPI0030B9E660